MTATPIQLADRLRAEGSKMESFFQNLAPQQWECVVYTDGSCWNVRQILAHFVSAEKGFAYIVRDILGGGPGAAEDLDLNAYNERKVAQMDSLSADDLLEQYSRLRAQFAGMVGRMELEDLRKTGRHPWLGLASLEDIIKLAYRHQQIHLREIRKTLA